MAADDLNHDESNPLLPNQIQNQNQPPTANNADLEFPSLENKPSASATIPMRNQFGAWTADGVPLSYGRSVIDDPVGRVQWNSGLFWCLGRNDEFCSSDLEVCLLGSVAPCVLYGSNVERLGAESVPGNFANHCLPYTGLYFLGNSLFGWNCLAPWFSYRSRTAMWRMFNLEGTCEGLNRSCGCCGSCMEDDFQREHCESGNQLVTWLPTSAAIYVLFVRKAVRFVVECLIPVSMHNQSS